MIDTIITTVIILITIPTIITTITRPKPTLIPNTTEPIIVQTKFASPELEIIALIHHLTPTHSPELAITAVKIAKCESSSLNPNATNPKSSATGLFQITKDTFNESKPAIQNNWTHELHAKDPEINIIVALYYLEKNQLSRWNESSHCWKQ